MDTKPKTDVIPGMTSPQAWDQGAILLRMFPVCSDRCGRSAIREVVRRAEAVQGEGCLGRQSRVLGLVPPTL